MAGAHLRDVDTIAAADPVNRRVEECVDVFADLEPVPSPRGPALVVAADLVHLQPRRLRELLGELDGQVRSFKGWVRSTISMAPLASASTRDATGFWDNIRFLLSVGAERLFEPLGSYLGIDLGVDHERRSLRRSSHSLLRREISFLLRTVMPSARSAC